MNACLMSEEGCPSPTPEEPCWGFRVIFRGFYESWEAFAQNLSCYSNIIVYIAFFPLTLITGESTPYPLPSPLDMICTTLHTSGGRGIKGRVDKSRGIETLMTELCLKSNRALQDLKVIKCHRTSESRCSREQTWKLPDQIDPRVSWLSIHLPRVFLTLFLLSTVRSCWVILLFSIDFFTSFFYVCYSLMVWPLVSMGGSD
jgi:hypothetical protein